MTPELRRVLDKDAKRYRTLREIFRGTRGEEHATVGTDDLAKELGVDLEELDDILTYLEREGLVRFETVGGDPGITHTGIREVEASIRTPSCPTSHFSVPVIEQVTNHFYGAVGAVQTGNHNTANVTQNFGVADETLLRVLADVRTHLASLAEPQRSEVLECLDGIATEAQTQSPSKGRLRALVQGTASTLKDFGVQVGANLLATWLASPTV